MFRTFSTALDRFFEQFKQDKAMNLDEWNVVSQRNTLERGSSHSHHHLPTDHILPGMYRESKYVYFSRDISDRSYIALFRRCPQKQSEQDDKRFCHEVCLLRTGGQVLLFELLDLVQALCAAELRFDGDHAAIKHMEQLCPLELVLHRGRALWTFRYALYLRFCA